MPESTIRSVIENTGPWGPVLITLMLFITYVIAPFSNVPVLYAGFYAYGSTVVLLSVIANYASFIVNFFIARTWGRPFVVKMIGEDNSGRLDRMIENYGPVSLFFLRAFQGTIHDFVSYAAGLTRMRFSVYISISILATTPGNALWYYIASRSLDPASFTGISILLTLIFSVIFVVGTLIFRRAKK